MSGLSVQWRRSSVNMERTARGCLPREYIDPKVAVSPQDAFYAQKESLPLLETRGRVVQ